MYDIFFDLNNMHQAVQESDDDEYYHIGERIDFDFEDDYPVIVHKSSKKKSNGCICDKCGELYPYAEPNRAHDKFRCWSCRHY